MPLPSQNCYTTSHSRRSPRHQATLIWTGVIDNHADGFTHPQSQKELPDGSVRPGSAIIKSPKVLAEESILMILTKVLILRRSACRC